MVTGAQVREDVHSYTTAAVCCWRCGATDALTLAGGRFECAHGCNPSLLPPPTVPRPVQEEPCSDVNQASSSAPSTP